MPFRLPEWLDHILSLDGIHLECVYFRLLYFKSRSRTLRCGRIRSGSNYYYSVRSADSIYSFETGWEYSTLVVWLFINYQDKKKVIFSRVILCEVESDKTPEKRRAEIPRH